MINYCFHHRLLMVLPVIKTQKTSKLDESIFKFLGPYNFQLNLNI